MTDTAELIRKAWQPYRSHATLDPSAVGHGITVALQATEDNPTSPEAWVHFCITAADEAYAAALEDPPPQPKGPAARLLEELDPEKYVEKKPDRDSPYAREAAHQAARTAFRMCMPKITGRRATQAYIACVAAGVQRQYLTGQEATSLLYTAQLALAAWPSKRAQRGKANQK